MNVPNTITVARIAAIPVFMIVLMAQFPHSQIWAAGLFTAIALTDTLDGFIARRYNLITRLGIILDPLADKLLLTAGLIELVQLGTIPGWMVVIILGREFAVMGLRVVKSDEGVIIPASKLGKIKTDVQMVAIVVAILDSVLKPFTLVSPGYWAMLLATVITIISGCDYFWKSFRPGPAA